MTPPEARDLDRLVVERVFGWGDFWTGIDQPPAPGEVYLLFGEPPGTSIEDERMEVPHYSTDMGAAWEIVLHVYQKLPYSRRVQFLDHLQKGISLGIVTYPYRIAMEELLFHVTPEAICRAALLVFKERKGVQE